MRLAPTAQLVHTTSRGGSGWLREAHITTITMVNSPTEEDEGYLFLSGPGEPVGALTLRIDGELFALQHETA